MQVCETCGGWVALDRLDGDKVCLSCGRRTAPPPEPARWPGRLPPMKIKSKQRIGG